MYVVGEAKENKVLLHDTVEDNEAGFLQLIRPM